MFFLLSNGSYFALQLNCAGADPAVTYPASNAQNFSRTSLYLGGLLNGTTA